ncbi:MAG: AbrB/MazE/SpoVT family DNA-binding domain-containing protein [Bacteroidota bacterium]
MKIKLINIGNSKGLRLSKALIQQYNITEDIQLELKEDGILLKPLAKPRSSWSEQFEKAVKPIEKQEKKWMEARNRFDKEEWTW